MADDSTEEDDDVAEPLVHRKFALVEVFIPNFQSGFGQPCPRSGLRMFCGRNYLYILGGYRKTSFAPMLQELWRFNTLTRTWKQLSVPSKMVHREMASFACCSLNIADDDRMGILIFGGTQAPFGTRCTNRVSLFTEYKGKLKYKELKTTGVAPIPQYGSSLLRKDDTFYVVGGTTGWIYNMEVHSLKQNDNKIWEWTLLSDGSEYRGRYRHEAVFLENEILVIGGAGHDRWVAPMDKVLVFDISKQKFFLRQTLSDPEHGYPSPRFSHSCVRKDSFIYVLGGCSYRDMGVLENYQAYNIFDDVWILDLSSWRWQLSDVKLGESTCFHGTTITNDGTIYLFGGTVDMAFNFRSNTLWKLRTNPASLFNLAADALLESDPKLRKLSFRKELTLENIHRVACQNFLE